MRKKNKKNTNPKPRNNSSCPFGKGGLIPLPPFNQISCKFFATFLPDFNFLGFIGARVEVGAKQTKLTKAQPNQPTNPPKPTHKTTKKNNNKHHKMTKKPLILPECDCTVKTPVNMLLFCFSH